MLGRARRFLLLAACVACLTCAGRAAAVAPEIKDGGKFFSEDAVKKANEQIREIARKYDKDLLVETFMTVPDDKAEKVKAMSRDEREKFFREWARQRAEKAVVNGVYVLVTKEPAHVHVEIAGKAGSALTPAVREKIVERLLEDFRAKKFDEGLQGAVKLVQEKLASAGK